MPIDSPIKTMAFIRIDEFQFDLDEKESILLDAVSSSIPDLLVDMATDSLGNALFQDNDALNNALGELVQTINPDTKVYKFRINPATLRVVKQKQQTLVEYGNEEFDLQQWKNKLDTYTYNGNTGSLVPSRTMIGNKIDDIRLSQAWQRFEIFKKYFSDTNSLLAVIFEDEIFVGFFSGSFTFDRDANDPFQIKYSFELKVIPSTRMSLITGVLGGLFGGLGAGIGNVLNTIPVNTPSVPMVGGGSVPNLLGAGI